MTMVDVVYKLPVGEFTTQAGWLGPEADEL